MFSTEELRGFAVSFGISGAKRMSRKRLLFSLGLEKMYYKYTVINVSTKDEAHFGTVQEIAKHYGVRAFVIRNCLVNFMDLTTADGEFSIFPY